MIRYLNEHDESFRLEHPECTSGLYFPLANEHGVMSSISPNLSGDLKISQNAFLLPPVSIENLHNDKSSRNIWVKVNGEILWSATGKSSSQEAQLFTDKKETTVLEAGFMHQKTERTSSFGLKAEITSYVPSEDVLVEVTGVTFTNTSSEAMDVEVFSATPIYGRSADNIRDHRHVTALLHRIHAEKFGVSVCPTMSFDERGHQKNTVSYGAYGAMDGEAPLGFVTTVKGFIGEGGSLENPRYFTKPTPLAKEGETSEGFEALGGLQFGKRTLLPGERIFCSLLLTFRDETDSSEDSVLPYLEKAQFEEGLENTIKYWREKVNIHVNTGNGNFNQWMRWVAFQPFLRRIYGCSFLPHHDYGKGGRGWRDLWQDCLALLIMEPSKVREMLLHNFAGVRIDGTNATIIGMNPGEFVADRNNITRVWMDHAMWPFLTTHLYIHQTGDLKLLQEETTYFSDPQIHRGEKKDPAWKQEHKNLLMDAQEKPYKGTVLEHILVEHLTAVHDVGAHGHLKIHGADWNDALDMADKNGESVAFTSMYAKNLEDIADLLMELKKEGHSAVDLTSQLQVLLQTTTSDFSSIEKKQERLAMYLNTPFTGERKSYLLEEIIESLRTKAAFMKEWIRTNEWLETEDGHGFFNGYYDNHNRRVEGTFSGGLRMMLTSQVFSVMSSTAEESQLEKIVRACDAHLYDPKIGGYKLNTNFHEVKMDLGRMFGFAYGHKENGAVFSHMTVMYGYALYLRGLAKEGYRALNTLFAHCADFENSKIYPGIPEYVDPEGRGMYHYLTGSASWMLLSVVTQMFGVRGRLGNLYFHPQLVSEQFDAEGNASILLPFSGRSFKIIYRNDKKLSPDVYKVKEILLNGKNYAFYEETPQIRKEDLLELSEDALHEITLILD